MYKVQPFVKIDKSIQTTAILAEHKSNVKRDSDYLLMLRLGQFFSDSVDEAFFKLLKKTQGNIERMILILT